MTDFYKCVKQIKKQQSVEDMIFDKLVARRYNFLAKQPEQFGGTADQVYQSSMYTVASQNETLLPNTKSSPNQLNFLQNTAPLTPVTEHELIQVFDRLHVQKSTNQPSHQHEVCQECSICNFLEQNKLVQSQQKPVQRRQLKRFTPVTSMFQIENEVKNYQLETDVSLSRQLKTTKYNNIEFVVDKQIKVRRQNLNQPIFKTGQKKTRQELRQLIENYK